MSQHSSFDRSVLNDTVRISCDTTLDFKKVEALLWVTLVKSSCSVVVAGRGNLMLLTDEELLKMLKDIESDRTERKASMADPARIRQAICAFANDLPRHDKPGVIFVGATDAGSCAHLPITDELLLRLSQMRDDGTILPFPSMTVQKRELDGGYMAVVTVEPSSDTPVQFDGRIWIRVGPRRARATGDEERMLFEKRRFKNATFDLQQAPGATIDDIDIGLFNREYLPASVAREVLDQNDRELVHRLISLRMCSPGEPVRPTIVGILALGLDPRQFLPGAYVQFIGIDGTELTDPIKDQKELAGPLSQQLRELDMLLEANNAVATEIAHSSTEIKRPQYPMATLQQLTRNAPAAHSQRCITSKLRRDKRSRSTNLVF
jgi:ATP-dependent DNA helicase RecG